MKDKLNVGLVGYKFMGKAHSNAFSKIGMFFNPTARIGMKAICGRDEEWVREAAGKLGWESWETSWEKLVRRDDIDIIDIGAPSNVHKEIALAAAQNGKHLFCEKPLALNARDAREMLEAVRKYNVKHQIGFNYRFTPAIQLAKRFIEQGKIGTVYHFRGLYLQDWLVDPMFPLVWRLDKSIAGSGSHGDLGAHIIDLARYLIGDFDKVMGTSRTFIKQRPVVEKTDGLSARAQEGARMGEVTVDDATLWMAEFKNGALGLFEATRFATGRRNGMSFEINGSKGSIRFDFERMNELQYYNREDEEGEQGFRLIQATEPVHPYMQAWWPAGHGLGYEHTFVHELYEFVEAVANDRQAVPDFTDGVKCSQVLDAIEVSAREGQWMQVDKF